MTLTELADTLRDEKFDPAFYDIAGGLPGAGGYRMQHAQSHWKITYLDRGIENFVAEFSSESEACDFFYQRVKKLFRR
jgi:hypothetical protein